MHLHLNFATCCITRLDLAIFEKRPCRMASSWLQPFCGACGERIAPSRDLPGIRGVSVTHPALPSCVQNRPSRPKVLKWAHLKSLADLPRGDSKTEKQTILFFCLQVTGVRRHRERSAKRENAIFYRIIISFFTLSIAGLVREYGQYFLEPAPAFPWMLRATPEPNGRPTSSRRRQARTWSAAIVGY